MNTILDGDFAEGDFLTAGVQTSTSSVNGITATINSNTITKLMLVGSDLTEGEVNTTTNETTIGSITVAAGTVSEGVFIIASLQAVGSSGVADTSTFRLKTGLDSSEVLRESYVTNKAIDEVDTGCIAWYDTAGTYISSAVSIIITGQNSNGAADSKSICHSIVAFGI